ncbi:hypothetical protein ACFL41_01835 [Gemmatimonadota bacterium]
MRNSKIGTLLIALSPFILITGCAATIQPPGAYEENARAFEGDILNLVQEYNQMVKQAQNTLTELASEYNKTAKASQYWVFISGAVGLLGQSLSTVYNERDKPDEAAKIGVYTGILTTTSLAIMGLTNIDENRATRLESYNKKLASYQFVKDSFDSIRLDFKSSDLADREAAKNTLITLNGLLRMNFPPPNP